MQDCAPPQSTRSWRQRFFERFPHRGSSDLRISNHVAGAQMASQARPPWPGAFTEYIAEKPDNLSVGMALWWEMKLPGTPAEPTPDAKFVLVYGGSTASSTFAIRLLKIAFLRSGYRVATTYSPKSFELVKECGTEKAFDYHSPMCGDDIRAYTKNTLGYALDIITEARTIRQCYAAIGRGGGRYIAFELLPKDSMAAMRKAVKPTWVMGLEVAGLELELPGGYYRKANPELHAWLQGWIRRFAALLESRKLKPHPIQVNRGGRAKAFDGIGTLQRKEVSAQKLVYPLHDY
ncbi:hypothetical protein BCR34DRAFT_607414 [Clohesyomyces aquaticus]|uniref:Uncharacterized protein n=1 Tax=Clohesyomyces aquaticus TaxID=1231657 RepID=A0A1Y1YGD8_9PLEO|nr:hypothetical protein BCR34DRAFT_607414 [Clohesyomyces aquaticus]